jgi:hypothetical protein
MMDMKHNDGDEVLASAGRRRLVAGLGAGALSVAASTNSREPDFPIAWTQPIPANAE